MTKKILFVDDDKNLLNSLKRVMHSYKKEWEMVFVESAEEALQKLSQADYDIIFADYKMPGMDGIAFLTRVKDNYPEIKRILLTGQSQTEIFDKAQSVVHKYIAKPCDYSHIIKEISDTQ